MVSSIPLLDMASLTAMQLMVWSFLPNTPARSSSVKVLATSSSHPVWAPTSSTCQPISQSTTEAKPLSHISESLSLENGVSLLVWILFLLDSSTQRWVRVRKRLMRRTAWPCWEDKVMWKRSRAFIYTLRATLRLIWRAATCLLMEDMCFLRLLESRALYSWQTIYCTRLWVREAFDLIMNTNTLDMLTVFTLNNYGF